MTDMVNNPLTLFDKVMLPFLRGTIYPHYGTVIAFRWYLDNDGNEHQRVKVLFGNGRERWYDTDSVVKVIVGAEHC